jgi:hypothetical protein
MAITLRVNKGTALSYNEMDVNLSSFFYSASLSNSNSTLTLHYTGSSIQGASSVSIPLDASGSSSGVAGSDKQIQYNSSGNFATSTNFIFDSSYNALGIGTTSVNAGERIRAYGGNVILQESELRFVSSSVSSSIFLDEGSDDLIIRHNKNDDDADIVFKTSNNDEVLRLKGDGSAGFNTSDTSAASVSISGSLAVGNILSDSYRSLITSFNSSDTRIENNTTTQNLSGVSRGLFIEGPKGGHVAIGIQTETGSIDQALETFSILSGYSTSSHNAVYHKNVTAFRADGSVAISDNNFVDGHTLSVSGSITGSGDLNIGGSTTITGKLNVNSELTGSGGLYISGGLGIEGIGEGTAGIGYDVLVLESNEVKYRSAGVVPVGAIIMWSGNDSSIPGGWHLCDGTNNTPNLRDRFIIGAGNTYQTGSTGGSNTHDHGGTTGAHTLSSTEIPAHQHTYKDSYYIEYNNPGVGVSGAIDGVDAVPDGPYKGSGNSDNDNQFVYYRNGTTNVNGSAGGSHTHTVSSANNLPVYYALSYIMYTGA